MLIARTPQSNHAPQDWFTGDVWYEELIVAPEPFSLRMLSVHFAPGARSWWHTHPVEQVIHVTEGTALVQREGELVRAVAAGESVWFEPGVSHWHGAAPGTFMTHLAAQQADAAGETVAWLRPVTDAEYRAA
ncbi:MAG: cupin domain-containing protein [Solirubrobacteraceae bacterium]|nr:cupin domain-containing protein [Solirubrobacteraceae bacterium]